MKEYRFKNSCYVVDDNGQIYGHLTHKQLELLDRYDEVAKVERKTILMRFADENKRRLEEVIDENSLS